MPTGFLFTIPVVGRVDNLCSRTGRRRAPGTGRVRCLLGGPGRDPSPGSRSGGIGCAGSGLRFEMSFDKRGFARDDVDSLTVQ
jgi:hypothetical protein